MQIALLLATLISITSPLLPNKNFKIRAAFSGMELSDEVRWYEVFEKSGTLLSSSMGVNGSRERRALYRTTVKTP